MTPTAVQRQALKTLGETVIDLDVSRSGAAITVTGEAKGVVYTKPWVVDLILDLAGYRPDRDLAGLSGLADPAP